MIDLVNAQTPRVRITATRNSPTGSVREGLFETNYNSWRREDVRNAVGNRYPWRVDIDDLSLGRERDRDRSLKHRVPSPEGAARLPLGR